MCRPSMAADRAWLRTPLQALKVLVSRLRRESLIYPGHEYTEMLLQMSCRRDPTNSVALAQLSQESTARSRPIRLQ